MINNEVDYLQNYLKDFLDATTKKFDINKFCFDKQLEFINDPAKYKVAVCSRRAGKTVGCAAHMIDVSLSANRIVCLYITLSRINAKRILWPDLQAINREHKLGGVSNETELSIKFPNGSVIYLSGAKDKSEIEKFRGLAIKLCYIDEAQSFRDYIRALVEEVISKALFDHNGSLCLTGTPSPVPSGYFHECWSSGQWSRHSWTMFDNPWLLKKSGLTPRQLVDQELKRKGVKEDNPTIQRECFGKWSVDLDALVFRYNKEINDYKDLPHQKGWRYIVGIDIGFDDADAIAVIAWHPNHTRSYLVDELVSPKQGITDLANQISRMIEKYNPDSIIMDTGGIGKKIAHEMNTRYQLPIKAAEKTRKFEFIEILNDALRTGSFMVHDKSRFVQDAMLVEWDKDSVQLKISDGFHSDICDAVLYAFRESLHWMAQPLKPRYKVNSIEWAEDQEKELEAQAIKNIPRTHVKSEDLLSDGYLSNDEGWD